MGFGDSPFGAEPAGDPLPIPNDPAVAARPRAIFFDPVTRDFPLDALGRYQDLHPIDAKVETIMFNIQGRIPSASDTGTQLNKVGNPYDVRAQSIAENFIRTALKPLTDAGDITILSIEYEPDPNGIKAELDYMNNRTKKKPQSPVQAYLGAK